MTSSSLFRLSSSLSACPQISAADAKALIAGIKDPTPFQAGGIKFGGVKYTFIRADPGRNVYGRQVRLFGIAAAWVLCDCAICVDSIAVIEFP